MRRWDLYGFVAGFGVAAFDLGTFAWAGLDVGSLTASGAGWGVLVGFVLGYGLFGFVCGRLYLARLRSKADADRIAQQLAALEESRARLLQSEKLAALGRLAAGIAHEVRNPLGVIRASASMVQEAFEGGTDDHRACELITDEIDRLDGLIGALLAFAKPARMALAPTELDPVIERAATLAKEARGVTVEAGVDPGWRVRADPDLLTQLLLGFFVNASEAGATRVAVRGTRAKDAIELEVADDGAGIAEADEARVFEPFFTTKDTGTGLGLSMAARIVEAHGGAIEVVQRRGLGDDGRGACFAIRLPVEGPTVVTEAA
ncbi:MAG: hypothetical protein H6719_27335 [Sandaracinaceae bacterium]|nr:hypothetical protein [Sandaracinaceae bacterium]